VGCCEQGGWGGEAVCVREGGVGSKNPKTKRGDSVSGVLCEMVVWGNDGRLLVQVNGIDAVGGGCTFANARPVSWVWAKNPKPSVRGSVSAVRHEMVGWDNDGRLWVRVNGMEAPGDCAFANAKPGVGFRPKTRNQVFVARFRACRVKQWCGAMMGDSGCGWMAWRRQGGCAFANAKPGVGFRPKTRNRVFVARFRACRVKWQCGAMMEDGGCGWIAWRRQGGCEFANAKPGVGFRPKTRNRVFVAQFRARCMKQRCRAVLGSGGCRLVTRRR
jgi:hypothetical protein